MSGLLDRLGSTLAAWELRRRRKARKRRGLCTDCGEREAMPGKRKCRTCQDGSNASSRSAYQERKAAGVCPKCGGARDSDLLECSTCRERQRAQRAKRKARGYVRPDKRQPRKG